LDGVLLANAFDEHAPLAIAALDAGLHVLSETAACRDEQEARALAAAVRRSAATYSFAENYVAQPHVREIAAAVAGSEVGDPVLIEAEYVHGLEPPAVKALTGDPAHWRGRIAPTAYCTHTLSPVLSVTGALPVDVSAFPVVEGEGRAQAVVLVVRLSSGALAIARRGFLQGESGSHWSWLSVRGTRGLVESLRDGGDAARTVRLRREPWAADGHPLEERRIEPELVLDGMRVPRMDQGTVRVLQAFRATIADGEPPLVDARSGIAASLVGVAGARSLAEGSRPIHVPDPFE
jgi:predicted dehydrogenase